MMLKAGRPTLTLRWSGYRYLYRYRLPSPAATAHTSRFWGRWCTPHRVLPLATWPSERAKPCVGDGGGMGWLLLVTAV